jgi:hypothetical protein
MVLLKIDPCYYTGCYRGMYRDSSNGYCARSHARRVSGPNCACSML